MIDPLVTLLRQLMVLHICIAGIHENKADVGERFTPVPIIIVNEEEFWLDGPPRPTRYMLEDVYSLQVRPCPNRSKPWRQRSEALR